MESIRAGDKVLLVWCTGSDSSVIKSTVESLESRLGNSGKVCVENYDRLLTSKHGSSEFDVILSGFVFPPHMVHSDDILAEIVRILKPKGKLALREVIGSTKTSDMLLSSLKLAGLVSVSSPKEITLSPEEQQLMKTELHNNTVVEVCGQKPDYEVGANVPLSILIQKKHDSSGMVSSDAAKVWSLAADDMMDDDVDLIDADTLLNEDDLKKPDPFDLKLSNCDTTTGKRKACKNCTCGLADELQTEKKSVAPKSAPSACGNCYLGDAFRCASCPYLGMPAFKPGEKILLSERQLNPDS